MYPYDSRNVVYKSVSGAVASNESLRLRLLLHNDAHVHEAFLCIKRDDERDFKELKLTPAEWYNDYRFYDIENTFDCGLYWYYFRYTSDYGEYFVKKTKHNLGIVCTEGDVWQLTVYDADYKTPDWLAGGLIYQIFPDRFYADKAPDNGGFDDRFVQNEWSAEPIYSQNDPHYCLGNDYFGGTLSGIAQKLPYLNDLGVTAVYLNPIFEAHSNHRYNTADYLKIDPILGNEDDLKNLCKKAKKYGISVILDGVFSHTGDDSIYFNKKGRYPSVGAYQSQSSPYYNWFSFQNYPNEYSSWWGINTLPETREDNADFNEYITGENGVIRRWLKAGIMGWRLDVADELPDCFIDNIRSAMKEENPDSFLLGEVWEDATSKISHGGRRRFLLGRQLDSVMNYPFYEAIIAYLEGGNSRDFIDSVLNVTENYPPQALRLLMNHIGTHDTARIITRLGDMGNTETRRELLAAKRLSNDEYSRAVSFVKLAATLQYTLPGVPSLYYGDEAGLEGYGDPFCRRTYPWGNENAELLEFYKKLGKLRKENICFTDGKFVPIYANMGHVVYMREKGDNKVLVAVNRWCDTAFAEVPCCFDKAFAVFGNCSIDGKLAIEPESVAVLVIK